MPISRKRRGKTSDKGKLTKSIRVTDKKSRVVISKDRLTLLSNNNIFLKWVKKSSQPLLEALMLLINTTQFLECVWTSVLL